MTSVFIRNLILLGCLMGLQACTNAVPKVSALNGDSILGNSTPQPLKILRVVANPNSGSYSLGQKIEIQILFSDVVVVQNNSSNSSARPKLQLETAITDHEAVYVDGSGTNTLRFEYLIVSGDSSSDLNYLNPNALNLNGSTLTGPAAQIVNKELPATDSPASLAGTSSISISGEPGFLVLFSGADFPSTLLNFSTKQFVTIKNQSTLKINIASMKFSDTTHFQFVGGAYPGTNGTCDAFLGAGATCTLNVVFAPLTAPAQLLTNLNISFSDGKTAITNSFPLSGQALASFNVAVNDAYVNGNFWNTYIKKDGTQFYDATNTLCTGTEVGDYSAACMHSAEIKKVTLTALENISCSNLSISDALGAFNWICENSSNGTISFYSQFLKPGKGLRDLIQANGSSGFWSPNHIEVRITSGGLAGSVYAKSSPAAWWSNSVQQLPVNTGSTLATQLNDPSRPIYVIGADQSTEGGYQIGADGISIVTLGTTTLTQSGASFVNNCKSDGGSTTIGLDVRSLFCGYQKKFLWFEVRLDGGYGTATNQAGAGIILNGTRLTRIQDSSFKNFNGITSSAALKLLNSSRNLLSRVQIYNANSALALENSNFNLIKKFQAAKIQYGGSTSAISLNTSDSNKFTDIQISGMNAGSYAYGFLSSNSNFNVFQRISISNIDAQANLKQGVGIELIDGTNNVLSQVTVTGVEGTAVLMHGPNGVSSNYFSNFNLINNDDFGLQLYGGLVTDNVFNSFVTGNNDTNISIYGATAPSLNNNFYNTVTTSSFNPYGSVTIDNNYQVTFNGYTISNFGDTNTCSVGNTKVNTNLTSNCRGTPEASQHLVMNSFVGKVISDDAANPADSSGFAAFSLLDSLNKWMDFAFPFRSWSRDGSTFPNSANQGACDGSFGCRIWDWRVKTNSVLENNSIAYSSSNAAFLFDGRTCSGSLRGNDTLTVSSITFMKYAIEIDGDDIGNDNGLCESNEECIYTPNIGAYQGEGPLASSNYCVTRSSGVNVTNAKIFKYPITSVP